MTSERPNVPSTQQEQYGLSSIDSATKSPPSASQFHPIQPSRLATFASRQPETRINSFSGAIAGVASGIVTCPLDVIKTKLQAQGSFRPRAKGQRPASGSPSYRGMLGTASVIWRQDGIRGMYRGLGPMLFGYLPTWAVYMTVYGSSRDYYYTKTDNRWLAQTYASITAGACSTLATNPIWVIKTRLMSQVGAAASPDARTPWHYHSTLDAFRKMYRNEGIRSFYSGLGPALLGLTHVAIQFPLYEFFKVRFTGLEMGEHGAEEHENHTLEILAATFLSKVCATSATYPHEVLRTRLQTQQRRRGHTIHTEPLRNSIPQLLQSTASSSGEIDTPKYQGILKTCRIIVREEGVRAFYYGMGTNLLRAVPAAMTTMLTFESVKEAVHRLQLEGRRIPALQK